MKSVRDDPGLKLSRFKATLNKYGIKQTRQRTIIFQEVAESEGHPDAEEVYMTVRKKLPAVSLDTVYRTLWMLKDLGLIHILGGRDRARLDGNMKPHHHFVCNECGLIRDFYSDEFSRLKIPKEIKSWGCGEIVHIEVKGICTVCFRKSKAKLRKTSRQ
jgi:Fur family transcriptional regulator, peroxide stress response regulator